MKWGRGSKALPGLRRISVRVRLCSCVCGAGSPPLGGAAAICRHSCVTPPVCWCARVGLAMCKCVLLCSVGGAFVVGMLCSGAATWVQGRSLLVWCDVSPKHARAPSHHRGPTSMPNARPKRRNRCKTEPWARMLGQMHDRQQPRTSEPPLLIGALVEQTAETHPTCGVSGSGSP